MSAEDHINYFDDREDEEPRTTECKQCGKGSLEWFNDEGRWRLLERSGKVHVCDPKRVHRSVADDFEVL